MLEGIPSALYPPGNCSRRLKKSPGNTCLRRILGRCSITPASRANIEKFPRHRRSFAGVRSVDTLCLFSKESRQILCEQCGFVILVEGIEVTSIGCGVLLSLPIHAGRFQCPYCSNRGETFICCFILTLYVFISRMYIYTSRGVYGYA